MGLFRKKKKEEEEEEKEEEVTEELEKTDEVENQTNKSENDIAMKIMERLNEIDNRLPRIEISISNL
ncbi:MAG TPA: hypothetical protein ENG16_03530, partial [Archaeoglobus sp.]|nr:hypothetical protein [Archaeoglobus sp.]